MTYEERVDLLSSMLRRTQISLQKVKFLPFPIDQPSALPTVLPLSVTCLVTVYEDWNREKIRRLESLGYAVEILYERPLKEKRYTGSAIRQSLLRGEELWKGQVPAENIPKLIELRLGERLSELVERSRSSAKEPQ